MWFEIYPQNRIAVRHLLGISTFGPIGLWAAPRDYVYMDFSSAWGRQLASHVYEGLPGPAA